MQEPDPCGYVDDMTPLTEARSTFGRVITAMVTPFDPAGGLDLPAARRVARHLVDTGHDGVLLSGTTGESPTTHGPEKSALIEAVRDELGDSVRIMAGACSNDTAHAVRMAESAAAAGADSLLVVSPYYNRPPQEGLYRHFVAIADSTDLPVMLYDIPGRTAIAIADETLDRLAEHPKILAVKDATGDVVRGMMRSRRTGLAYYSGDDAVNFAWMTHGGAGVVSVIGHVAGQRWADMIAALDADDLARAREIFAATMPAVDAIMGTGIGAVMVKAALEVVGVLDNRTLRLPLVEADDDQVKAVREGLAAANLL